MITSVAGIEMNCLNVCSAFGVIASSSLPSCVAEKFSLMVEIVFILVHVLFVVLNMARRFHSCA